MTEQELKEKIVRIVIDSIWKDAEADYESTDESAAKTIADALIAAEIGDVSELKKECNSKEEACNKCYSDYRYWKEKAKEYKHRAEVAERALDLCETAYVLAINGMKTHGISLQAITSDLGVHGFFMRQAEKELQEERKDDNK